MILPEWFKYTTDKSAIATKDVLELFAYSSTATLLDAVANDRFPKPDKTIKSKGDKLYWLKSTLLKELDRRESPEYKEYMLTYRTKNLQINVKWDEIDGR